MNTNNALPTFEQIPSILNGLMEEMKNLQKLIHENSPSEDNDKLLSNEEVREILGVSEPTLWKYRKYGLQSSKIGNKVFFTKGDLNSFIQKHKVKK